VGSARMTAPGAQRHGLGEGNVVAGSGMASHAWGWRLHGRRCHRFLSGKMAAHKGARPWSGMTARRLQGGLNNSVEAPGRTRQWHEFWGGRQRHRLQGKFQWENLVA
jgi:hypothetical protein